MAALSKYREVRTIAADNQNAGVDEVNRLLAQGWELIDAKVVQWTHIEPKHPPGYTQAPQWYFVLGKS